MNQIQPLDWSATAAWIALIISIVGTVVGPIVTTTLTNRHQLKLRDLELKQNRIDEYEKLRYQAINNFISNTGKLLACADVSTSKESGSTYHNVYIYVPKEMWPELDSLYESIDSLHWDEADSKFPAIIHKLAELLKESHQ